VVVSGSSFRWNDEVVSAKTSAARRAAFFKALRETGNQTLACERARVSRSWMQLQRSSDPQFRAEMASAIEEAKARLDALGTNGGGRQPPRGWGHLDGEELVVKGTGGSALRHAQGERKYARRIQIARARLKQWTPRVERRFLAALIATCNVKAACAEVGMTPASAYAHRKRWPRFGALWADAVAEGYARLEIALLESGLNLFSALELPSEAPLPGMDVAQAIHLLHMHKNGVLGLGKAPGVRWRPPLGIDHPKIRGGIERKVRAIIAARDIPARARAADARAYAKRRG